MRCKPGSQKTSQNFPAGRGWTRLKRRDGSPATGSGSPSSLPSTPKPLRRQPSARHTRRHAADPGVASASSPSFRRSRRAPVLTNRSRPDSTLCPRSPAADRASDRPPPPPIPTPCALPAVESTCPARLPAGLSPACGQIADRPAYGCGADLSGDRAMARVWVGSRSTAPLENTRSGLRSSPGAGSEMPSRRRLWGKMVESEHAPRRSRPESLCGNSVAYITRFSIVSPALSTVRPSIRPCDR